MRSSSSMKRIASNNQCLLALVLLTLPTAFGFQPIVKRNFLLPKHSSHLKMAENSEADPQVLASGYSQEMILSDAIQEAMDMALSALPRATSSNAKIDLAIVSTSSLYDGNSNPSDVVPAVLQSAEKYGQGIQTLIGSSSGGFVSSRPNLDNQKEDSGMIRSCFPIERESVPGVSVMLCILPDVNVKVRISVFIITVMCIHLQKCKQSCPNALSLFQ